MIPKVDHACFLVLLFLASSARGLVYFNATNVTRSIIEAAGTSGVVIWRFPLDFELSLSGVAPQGPLTFALAGCATCRG